jgi:cardiolipin synthase
VPTAANSTPRLLAPESLATIARLAQAPLRAGHDVRILRDGALAFPAMLALIRAARRSVCFENFIFANDATGERFATALARAGDRGASVRVLYDPVGTLLVRGGSIARRLKRARIRARAFRPVGALAPWSWLHLRHRDHRKLLIADQLGAVVAGLCVSDNWAPAERGGGGWRDTAVLVRGPAVADLQLAFERMWHRARATARAADQDARLTMELPRAQPAPPPKGDATVVVVGDRPGTRRVAALYEWLAAQAEESIELSDAYMVAPRPVTDALIAAARRGVRVRILLPGRNNHPIAGLAARRTYGPLLEAGAEIHEWDGVMLHAKTVVVDAAISMIGSSNLDPLSLHRNYELNVLIADLETGARMRDLFAQDLRLASPITPDQWRRRPLRARLAEWLAGWFEWNL